VINRFLLSGIELTTGGGNWIEGNYIGTNTTGTVAMGNGRNGVLIFSDGNLVGTNGDGLDDFLLVAISYNDQLQPPY